jgi:hypothetical protein
MFMRARSSTRSYYSCSIPFEMRDGEAKHMECKMYDRNYTEILHLWTKQNKNPNEILINHKHLLDANEMKKNYEIINCEHGWTYDKSIFPTTVISEV